MPSCDLAFNPQIQVCGRGVIKELLPFSNHRISTEMNTWKPRFLLNIGRHSDLGPLLLGRQVAWLLGLPARRDLSRQEYVGSVESLLQRSSNTGEMPFHQGEAPELRARLSTQCHLRTLSLSLSCRSVLDSRRSESSGSRPDRAHR